jgi:phosphate:Na+ symporter
MAEVLKHYDLAGLNNYPLFVFTITGFLLTAVIQSSSATMALALSALFVNAISLYEAMAISLGAEAGSALKLFLASAKGHKVKKIIAVANFSFNVIISIIFLVLIRPLHDLVVHTFSVNNKLIALVLFQTVVNFSGILLFGPFVGRIASFLEKMYTGRPDTTLALHQVAATEPKAALEALEADTKTFIHLVLNYCRSAVHLDGKMEEGVLSRQLLSRPVEEKYLMLKNIHGELHNYIIEIGGSILNKDEAERLEQLVSSTRNGLYAAKSIKDAVGDIGQLYNSSNDIKYNYYLASRKKIEEFSRKAGDILARLKSNKSDEISSLYQSIQAGYHQSVKDLYSKEFTNQLSDEESSTLFNFNREIYTAFKSMVFALKDFLLDFNQARKFDETPGFIR